jgi:uncharacterized membrane protein (DUF106 family)
MSLLNTALRTLFDGFLFPFRGLPPLYGLLAVSLLTAIGMLLVFKATSNQEALDQVKRRIHACLFEIRLHNDDLRAILRAQFEILRRNLTYLRLSLVPMVWIILPLAFVIAQLQFHYGYEGLRPGEMSIIEVRLRERVETGESKPLGELIVPEGLRVETQPVWIPSDRKLAWRIGAEKPGMYELEVSLNGKEYTKSAVVTSALRRLSPKKVSGWLNEFVYPAEKPLDKSGEVESISLGYREREIGFLGLELHWLIVFFVLTIVFAFLLRKPLGVTI